MAGEHLDAGALASLGGTCPQTVPSAAG
jgi:hypothetical protein